MSLWIFASLAAAAFQTVRFMLQKTLAHNTLSATGATFARFLYSAPFAVLGVLIYSALTGQSLEAPGWAFWVHCAMGGTAQVLATVCLVKLFQARNFAVGLTFAKTETLLTVFIGLLILGEGVSLAGFAFIALGALGVVLLSVDPKAVGVDANRMLNRASGLGVASGLLFSISAVSYRGASLEVMTADPFLRSGLTLAVVTTLQMIGMALWLGLRESGEIGRVVGAWKSAGFIGLTSLAGSFGWFTAFTLQNAAYVKAVGQVELIFGLFASVLFFKETLARRELLGMAILTASILGVVLTL